MAASWQTLVLQVIEGVESSFLIHHANAFEEGDEIVVWSSGWSPEAVQLLATTPGSGMLGSWKIVMEGDFKDVPVSSLWSHRSVRLAYTQCCQNMSFHYKRPYAAERLELLIRL